MPRTLLRFKLQSAQVLELDPTEITFMRVMRIEDDVDYMLTVANKHSEFIVETGTFDACHTMLNKLHNYLNVYIVDL